MLSFVGCSGVGFGVWGIRARRVDAAGQDGQDGQDGQETTTDFIPDQSVLRRP